MITRTTGNYTKNDLKGQSRWGETIKRAIMVWAFVFTVLTVKDIILNMGISGNSIKQTTCNVYREDRFGQQYCIEEGASVYTPINIVILNNILYSGILAILYSLFE